MIIEPPPIDLPRIRGYEDLAPGARFQLGAVTIDRADLRDFAERYDPQPFHLDETAAAVSIFGRLVASGFQTMAAVYAVTVYSGLLAEVNLGGKGMEQVSWLRSWAPGERLSVDWTIDSVIPSRTRPDRAAVKIRYHAQTDDGQSTLIMLVAHILRGRPAGQG